MIINTYYRSDYGQSLIKEMVIRRNEEDIRHVIRVLDIESGSEDIVRKNLQDRQRLEVTSSYYTIYLTDEKGNVIDSTSDLKVDKITLEEFNSFKIDKNMNRFVGKNFIKLSNNRYVVLINNGYYKDDIYLVIACLLMIVIVFLILIKGRVKYINRIALEVREIAKGDLSKRVTIKYNNELSDLAKDINYMTEEIENQDNKQKEFITNISHDLRTPLTTIMGYLKMIEEKKYSNEKELQKYVAIASKKGNYLKLLLEDFFSYSKLSSNDIEIDKLEINLNSCVREIIFEEEENFSQRNLRISSDISNSPLIISGDPMLVGRVFENLIGNTIRYSKENTKVNIVLKEEIINNKSYGTFVTTNIPKEEISNKEVDKLFDRLYKKSSSRTEGGSGLGLAISQEIVRNHNGFITAKKIEEKIEFRVGFRLV